MADSFANLIGGTWTSSSSGEVFEQRNPACLSELTGQWPSSTREDAQAAIDSAQQAFSNWAALTPYQRAEYLRRALRLMGERKEEIARIITRENGKTLKESRAEIDSAIWEMDFQINEGLRLFGQQAPSRQAGMWAVEMYVPLGVVSVISPWNFPFNVPTRKCVPALMAGNTVVFKPASLTPQCGYAFVKLFHDSELPPGVLNFVCGSGSTVGKELTTNASIKAISFTGSTEVGRRIHQDASALLIRTQLELGGKNAMVVCADADLNLAARDAVLAAYACAGQWCTSTSRVIADASVVDALTEKIVEGTRRLRLGSGLEDDTDVGPVCGLDQFQSIGEYIDLGRREGATMVCGGEVAASPEETGCFIPPTVFTNVQPSMRIAQEEIFGPVLCILSAKSLDEAIRIANGVEYGLSSSIYTSDLHQALRFVEQTEVGLAHVNSITAYKEPTLSFGGVKCSGVGIPEAGSSGIRFFTNHKVAYINHAAVGD